jgi:hypothetical protein
MVNREIWRTDAHGNLSAEGPRLRLTVRNAGSWVQYIIQQRAGCGEGSSEVMLSSGIAPDVKAAIVAVEKVATRVDFMLAERSRLLGLR